MKKLAALALGLSTLAFLSCGDGSGEKSTTPVDTITVQGHENDTMVVTTKDTVPAGVHAKDPVCGMDYEAKWTLNSTYKDTKVAFCSPLCKETFDKNPDKFMVAGATDEHANHNH